MRPVPFPVSAISGSSRGFVLVCRFQGPSQAFLKIDNRLIIQYLSDTVETGLGVADIAGADRSELGLEVGSQVQVDGRNQVKQTDSPAGPDVVDSPSERPRMPERGKVGGHGIGNISEVAV